MSELNVNVLVAAKEEYTKQFINCTQNSLYDIIKEIYRESQKNNLRLTVSYSNFQKELKAVPSWATFKLEEKLDNINKKFPYLMDLITAIFVSHVKILACVRLKSDDKSVKIKVPSLNTFLHKIIINVSENIYYTPTIINEDKNKIFELIVQGIDETIANQIPIEYILSEYLSGAFDEKENKYSPSEQIIEDPFGNTNENEEDEMEESDDEEEQNRQIPIIPIEKPLSKRIPPGFLKDENLIETRPEPVKEPPNEEPNSDDIEEIGDLKNVNPDSQLKVNKRAEIEDDSDDELSDEEDLQDDDRKETTLF